MSDPPATLPPEEARRRRREGGPRGAVPVQEAGVRGDPRVVRGGSPDVVQLADRRGRRTSMMIAVAMMCGGSLLVTVLPTYASWGVAAPLLLLFARLLQGLSVGGEYGTCATYMSEVPLQRHRGFYASFQYVTLIGGQDVHAA